MTKSKNAILDDLQKALSATAAIALHAATEAVEEIHPNLMDDEKSRIIGPLSAALVSQIDPSEVLANLPK